MKKGYFAILAGVLLVLVVALIPRAGRESTPATPAVSNSASAFPEQLGTYILSNVETGEAALESIKRLHGFSTGLKMVDAFIVDYSGPGGSSIRIWIARAEDRARAKNQLRIMTEKIDPEDGFTAPELVALSRIDLPLVYRVEGYGADHYYYAKGNSLYWIAFTNIPDSAQQSLLEQALDTVN